MLHLHGFQNRQTVTLGDCLATLLPKLLTKLPSKAKQSSVGYTQRIWSITGLGQGLSDHALSRAPKQQALILDLQKQNPNGLSDEELRAQGHTLQSARELARKALIDSRQQQFVPADCAALIQGTGNDNKLALNNEQQIALEGVEQNFGQFAVSLLEGITGSGKTEVYLQAIEHIIANRQQVLVLVPEIGLTPQTVARFANRFNCQIAVLHSNLNDNERLAAWQSARCGQAQIIIGTRSAVFSPLIRPGLIIVDEEHDNSYKQQEGLRYHARDVAIMRGQFEAIPVLLGSATPSLESLQNAVRGKFHHLHLKQRAGGAKPAEIEFIDLRQQVLHEGLADQSIQAIADTLAAGEQALVFINRRGFAPLLMCQDCGWSAECHNCDARLTLHMAAKHMRCHHCDQVAAIPNHCPRCQSTQIQYLGQGTERSSEALRKLFPDTDVIRIDRDTSRKKSALTNYIAAINSNKSLIVVGTQMLAKGHDFKNLNTVIVLNVDDALYQADFRATEKTLQLLTQVSGRAGRSSQKGRVLIQTHLPDHPLLQSWAEHSYQGVSREMLQERENRGMPPYNYLALLRADSTQSQQAIQFLQQTANLLKTQYAPQSQLIGPLPALMEKRAGRHRALRPAVRCRGSRGDGR